MVLSNRYIYIDINIYSSMGIMHKNNVNTKLFKITIQFVSLRVVSQQKEM